MQKSNKPPAAQTSKDQLIADILLLQKNITKFDSQIAEGVEQRKALQTEFRQATGKLWVQEQRKNKYNRVPAELAAVKPDPQQHVESMREAYAQNSHLLMEKTLARVKESNRADKLAKQVQACEVRLSQMNNNNASAMEQEESM